MDNIMRLQLRTKEPDTAILEDCLESAKAAIMARRHPYGDWPEDLDSRYRDLQFRIALEIYSKDGADGETAHSENGISRSYENAGISESLLSEVVPLARGTK